MSNTEGVLKEAGTLLFARAHEFTSNFDEIRVFLFCPMMCIYVTSSPKTMMEPILSSSSLQGRMSCLRYLCLVVYNGTQHILCCVFVFVLFFFVLYTLSCQFIQVVHVYCPFDIL